ncbi:MAG: KEOPS complex subunit Pcc1 [Ignisphaera sp.]|nr:KEOPS complex subunit Pcc1 [Ignisphaera sp.]MDW8084994.1 KEOPS complex subunit Pcc1 [Ignisphaera sp.]
MPDKNYHAEITLCHETVYEKLLLNIIERSIAAEVANPVESSIEAKIELIDDKRCLKMYVNTDSLSRIRAIVNSYLYLINSIERTIDTVNRIKQH